MLAPELAAAFPENEDVPRSGDRRPDRHGALGLDRERPSRHGSFARPDGPGRSVWILNLDLYISFRKADLQRQGGGIPDVVLGQQDVTPLPVNDFPISNGGMKRVYRLALAANGEYTVDAGGTKAGALARIVTTMNRVNGIYERDLAINFTVATGTITDPTALIYADPLTDPYTNSNRFLMADENQTNLDAVIGTAGYDVGHVFAHENEGGVAFLQGVCSVSLKGRGVSGNLFNLSEPPFPREYGHA